MEIVIWDFKWKKSFFKNYHNHLITTNSTIRIGLNPWKNVTLVIFYFWECNYNNVYQKTSSPEYLEKIFSQ